MKSFIGINQKQKASASKQLRVPGQQKPQRELQQQQLEEEDSWEQIDPDDADQTGKFEMPDNFYQRVMEMEREVDKLKGDSPEHLLKGLMRLYSDAIEYFGFIDQP